MKGAMRNEQRKIHLCVNEQRQREVSPNLLSLGHEESNTFTVDVDEACSWDTVPEAYYNKHKYNLTNLLIVAVERRHDGPGAAYVFECGHYFADGKGHKIGDLVACRVCEREEEKRPPGTRCSRMRKTQFVLKEKKYGLFVKAEGRRCLTTTDKYMEAKTWDTSDEAFRFKDKWKLWEHCVVVVRFEERKML